MLQRIGRGWGLTKASWAVLKVPPKPLRLAIVSELILPGPILSGPILSGPILSGPILSGPILSGLAGVARLTPASH